MSPIGHLLFELGKLSTVARQFCTVTEITPRFWAIVWAVPRFFDEPD